MTIFQAIILGIVQGLTEFLPISSSGHLVLVENFLQWDINPEQIFIFDILVQMGTLVAVIYFFWDDLLELINDFWFSFIGDKSNNDGSNKLMKLLIVATIPAGIMGILLKDIVEKLFNNITATGFFLIFTAILMIFAEKVGKQNRDGDFETKDAILMGLYQAIAIFPGISRSGATISAGLFQGLTRSKAARFSFLMSIPVMLAAGLWALKDITQLSNPDGLIFPLLIGFITAAITGYLSIKWLLTFLTNNSLSKFSSYLIALGLTAILFG